MINEMGGLKEIYELFDAFNQQKRPIDFEKGILQAIGYKEFYPLYQYIKLKYNEDPDQQ